MGLKLVLAGLTGEDNDEGEAEVVNDGFLDGEGDLALVGRRATWQAEAQATGPRRMVSRILWARGVKGGMVFSNQCSVISDQ